MSAGDEGLQVGGRQAELLRVDLPRPEPLAAAGGAVVIPHAAWVPLPILAVAGDADVHPLQAQVLDLAHLLLGDVVREHELAGRRDLKIVDLRRVGPDIRILARPLAA